MKLVAYVVLFAGMSVAGCEPMGSFFRDDKKPPQVEMQVREPSAVTADGITGQNAMERAKALREEMEFDLKPKPQRPEVKP